MRTLRCTLLILHLSTNFFLFRWPGSKTYRKSKDELQALQAYLCLSIFWCKYSFDIEWHVFIFLGLWKYRSNQIIASYFNYLNYLFAAELLRDHWIWVLYNGHIKHLKNCCLTTNPLCCYFVHSATLLIFQGVLEDWRRYLGKVFKNEPSKICERQPLKNLKWHGLPKQYYTETNKEHFPLIH